jgi:hypothetical protein
LRQADTIKPPVEINNLLNGRITMTTKSERLGQLEIGIVTHNGHVYAAFGSSVNGHNVTAYTCLRDGHISQTRWDGSTMVGCRSEIVREFYDRSIALMFRLTDDRFIVGYALGDDGMLFRGELLIDCTDQRARQEALTLAEHWSEIDQEDEADSWHGEQDDTDYPD